MKALSQDNNWLKIIGIILVLSATMLFYQCSHDFTHRAEGNAPYLVRSVCLSQIETYQRTGRFMEGTIAQGEFPNPYSEFYSHSIRYEGEKAFHYATSKLPHFKSYVGLVVGFPNTNQSNASKTSSANPIQKYSAIAIVCEATKPGVNPANDPQVNSSTLTCSSQTRQVDQLLSLR